MGLTERLRQIAGQAEISASAEALVCVVSPTPFCCPRRLSPPQANPVCIGIAVVLAAPACSPAPQECGHCKECTRGSPLMALQERQTGKGCAATPPILHENVWQSLQLLHTRVQCVHRGLPATLANRHFWCLVEAAARGAQPVSCRHVWQASTKSCPCGTGNRWTPDRSTISLSSTMAAKDRCEWVFAVWTGQAIFTSPFTSLPSGLHPHLHRVASARPTLASGRTRVHRSDELKAPSPQVPSPVWELDTLFRVDLAASREYGESTSWDARGLIASCLPLAPRL